MKSAHTPLQAIRRHRTRSACAFNVVRDYTYRMPANDVGVESAASAA